MPEHRAYLTIEPDPVIEPLAEMATKNGFDVHRLGKTCKIDAPLGYVTIARAGSGADVTFGAETPAKLQSLKDLYAQRIANLGYGEAMQWETPKARTPLNQRLAHVVSTQRISPSFMRMRLEGDFTAFLKPGAGLHFRLLFSLDGSDWPTLDDRGITHWPGGSDNWHSPVYTIRMMGPDAGWVDVDVVLHDGGRVTDWIADVIPGTEIAVLGPSGGGIPEAQWFGLIGDETALPVMMRIIEAAPAGAQGQAVIFIRDWDDAQPVETASDIQVRYAQMHVDDPVDAIRALSPKGEHCHIFFAAERSQATRAREVFKEMGFAPRACKAASYWTNHKNKT